jgi:hypothetical protein
MDERIVLAVLVIACAGIVAGVLYYIAYNELGAPRETIRIEALILAACIGIGLLAKLLQQGKK